MSNKMEMIEQLMKDYIEEMKKPKRNSTGWYSGWTMKKSRNNTKLRRIRLLLQEKMLELERDR